MLVSFHSFARNLQFISDLRNSGTFRHANEDVPLSVSELSQLAGRCAMDFAVSSL
jgi:hypothetical protein